jgi:hypothetical protein
MIEEAGEIGGGGCTTFGREVGKRNTYLADACCACRLLRRHTQWRAGQPPHAPLFRSNRGTGSVGSGRQATHALRRASHRPEARAKQVFFSGIPQRMGEVIARHHRYDVPVLFLSEMAQRTGREQRRNCQRTSQQSLYNMGYRPALGHAPAHAGSLQRGSTYILNGSKDRP